VFFADGDAAVAVGGLVSLRGAFRVDVEDGPFQRLFQLAHRLAGCPVEHAVLHRAGLVFRQVVGGVADRGDPAFVQAALLPQGEGFREYLFELGGAAEAGFGGAPGEFQGEPDFVGGVAAHRAGFVGGEQGGVVAGAAAGELGQQPGLAGLGPAGEAFETDHGVDQLRVRQGVFVPGVGVDFQGEQAGGEGVAVGAVVVVLAEFAFDAGPVEGVLEFGLGLAPGVEHVFEFIRV
jgi:hypothetical protein